MDIIIKNLYKSYGNVKVLNNYSNVIKENRVTFITGSSGIGKTTLIKILMGLESKNSGEILGLEDKKISVVFQEDSLCESLSVIANLKLVCDKVDSKEVDQYLEVLELDNCKNKRVKELSGGMKRRVAILRALIYDFNLIIMDEPFKGLDLKIKHKVISFVKSKIKNKTVIIITHDLEELKYFDNHDLILL